MTSRLAKGVIRGKTIELDRDLGLVEGEEVEVRLTIAPKPTPWGEGILRSAGGWTDHPELDAVFDEIQQDRARERRPQGIE
ncbi:hypothetical protein EP7_000064 [Isosphaeraceae bacterium EP7]